MIEVLNWINDNPGNALSYVLIAFWFFWLLIDKWQGN
jgi:hypothetical protein